LSAQTVAILVDEEELNALIPLIGASRKMDELPPVSRVALRIVAASVCEPGTCMVCECTEDDCSGCIQRTGGPCHWLNENRTVCSACL
jgi:hypothetical protein